MTNTFLDKIFGKDEIVKNLTAENETLKASLLEATNSVSTYETTITTLADTMKAKDEDIASKVSKITELETQISSLKNEGKKAAEIAVQHLSTAGVQPSTVTVDDTEKLSAEELNKQLNAITDLHERSVFFQKNKSAFYGNK